MKVEHLVVGVIGLGMGKLHLQGVLDYGATVGLICDSNPERLCAVGEELGIPEEKRTTDYRDIVKSREINAVIIATPDQQHRAQIEELLAAGVSGDLVRYSCGLENAEDLIADLKQALESI